jgi:hypothetical protein
MKLLLHLLTSLHGTQEPSGSALGWSAYRGAADYDAGALSSPEPQLLTPSRHRLAHISHCSDPLT